MNKALISVALALGTFLSTAPATLAATPSCEDPWVVWTVSHQFGITSRQYLRQPLSIADFGTARESRRERADKVWTVERRYCETSITTNDGVRRDLWYLIESNFNFAGLGSSVELCVGGLDPWKVYGADCKSLR